MKNFEKPILPSVRIKKLYKLLYCCHGPQGWWPLRTRRIEAGADIEDAYGFNSSGYHPGMKYIPGQDDIFEIAAGAVLTQNTSWKNAASAIDNLISAGCLDPLSIKHIDTGRLSTLIRVSGYHNQKAKKLKTLAELFLENTSGEISREKLLSVWGVGPETADSIMLYGLNQPFFVIDAYSRRILSRFLSLDAVSAMDYEQLRLAVEQAFPAEKEAWREYHALLVIQGKKHCRKTPDCTACPIKTECDGHGWPNSGAAMDGAKRRRARPRMA